MWPSRRRMIRLGNAICKRVSTLCGSHQGEKVSASAHNRLSEKAHICLAEIEPK